MTDTIIGTNYKINDELYTHIDHACVTLQVCSKVVR